MLLFLFLLCASHAWAQTGGIISGRVYHDEIPYNPIPGVYVICYDFYSDTYMAMGITQDDGSYLINIQPGDYKILVNSDIEDQPKLFIPEYYNDTFDSYFAQKVSVSEGQILKNIDFALSVGGVIQGYVFDKNNTPIVSAKVEAYDLFGDLQGYTTSLENGQYFLHVPEGNYKIRSYTKDREYVTAFYPDTFSFPDAEQIEVKLEIGAFYYNFYLIEGVMIQGIVTNNENIPVPNVYIWAYGIQQEHWALTRDDGTYSMIVPPGNYFFYADDRNIGLLNQYFQNAYDIMLATPISVYNELDIPPIDFKMVYPAWITGTVMENWNSSPVNNIQVLALDAETRQIVKNVRTASDGTYVFSLPEGQYVLVVDDIQTKYVYQIFNQVTLISKAQPLTIKESQTLLSANFFLVHLSDLIMMLQCLSTHSTPGLNINPLDINGNNRIDMPDVLYLLTIISLE